MAKKNEEKKQKEVKVVKNGIKSPAEDIEQENTTTEEIGVNPMQDIEQEKHKIKETKTLVSETPKKCGRCGAELVSGKTECPVCLAPASWKR